MDPANEAGAPASEEVPLVLNAEPQAPTWARHIIHFLQTGELPSNQYEAERVARRASMYQFVNDTLYRRRPNGVKLKCVYGKKERNCWLRYTKGCVAPTLDQGR